MARGDVVARDMISRNTRGLRIRTKCGSLDELVKWFNRFCDEKSIFIATHAPREEGLETAFSIDLATGQPALVGEGMVLASWPTKDNRFGLPGMQIGVNRLSSSSTSVFEQMLVARAIAIDAGPSPQSWEEGTEVGAPSFDDMRIGTAPATAPVTATAPTPTTPITAPVTTTAPIAANANGAPKAKPAVAGPKVITLLAAPKPIPVVPAVRGASKPAAPLPIPKTIAVGPGPSADPPARASAPRLGPASFAISVPTTIPATAATKRAPDAQKPAPAKTGAMPKLEAKKAETPTGAAPKLEAKQAETPTGAAPKLEAKQAQTPTGAAPKLEAKKAETPRTDAPRVEAKRLGPLISDAEPTIEVKRSDVAPNKRVAQPLEVATPKPELATPKPELAAPTPAMVASKPGVVAPKPEVVTPKPEVAAPVHQYATPATTVLPPTLPAATPARVEQEPTSSRIPRAGTVLGSGPTQRTPARVVEDVRYDADGFDEDEYKIPTAVAEQESTEVDGVPVIDDPVPFRATDRDQLSHGVPEPIESPAFAARDLSARELTSRPVISQAVAHPFASPTVDDGRPYAAADDVIPSHALDSKPRPLSVADVGAFADEADHAAGSPALDDAVASLTFEEAAALPATPDVPARYAVDAAESAAQASSELLAASKSARPRRRGRAIAFAILAFVAVVGAGVGGYVAYSSYEELERVSAGPESVANVTVNPPPLVAPAEPVAAESDPTVAGPSDPSAVPSDPTVAPSNPAAAPSDPAVAAIDPSVAPSNPIDPSAAPSDPSAAPSTSATAPSNPATATPAVAAAPATATDAPVLVAAAPTAVEPTPDATTGKASKAGKKPVVTKSVKRVKSPTPAKVRRVKKKPACAELSCL